MLDRAESLRLRSAMHRVWIAVAVAVGVILVACGAAWYRYFHAEHVIFSGVRDGLSFRVYCQYRGTFTYTTYLELSAGHRTISVNELPPSTDDLTDCKARFPITDVQPDPTYSYLTVSFDGSERRPLTVPLALAGLDLPDHVRATIEKSRGCSYEKATCY